MSHSPYDQFIAVLKARKIWDAGILIRQMVGDFDGMALAEKYAQVNKLKEWLDDFRPLPSAVVAELKQLFDVRFTYNSNAIEGNTLTQSETQLVLEKGITVGGKTLREHLEVVGHRDAIDYVESLAQKDTAIGEWEIRQIHSLLHEDLERIRLGWPPYLPEENCQLQDENGRTGRLLMNWLLLRVGYPMVVISNEQRGLYIESLVEVQ